MTGRNSPVARPKINRRVRTRLVASKSFRILLPPELGLDASPSSSSHDLRKVDMLACPVPFDAGLTERESQAGFSRVHEGTPGKRRINIRGRAPSREPPRSAEFRGWCPGTELNRRRRDFQPPCRAALLAFLWDKADWRPKVSVSVSVSPAQREPTRTRATRLVSGVCGAPVAAEETLEGRENVAFARELFGSLLERDSCHAVGGVESSVALFSAPHSILDTTEGPNVWNCRTRWFFLLVDPETLAKNLDLPSHASTVADAVWKSVPGDAFDSSLSGLSLTQFGRRCRGPMGVGVLILRHSSR